MSRGRKPKDKHTLTIHFDTKVGIENFIAWYLQSGEQRSNYYSKCWGKDWIYVQPSDDCCPSCEFPNEDVQGEFYDDRSMRTRDMNCDNCDHEYVLKNPYKADGT